MTASGTSHRAHAHAAALAFQRQTIELAADQMRPITPGWVARSQSLPMVWGLNHVRLTRPVTYAQALALAEEHLGDLPYRHLIVEHQPTAERLEAPFLADGWKVDREVMMVLARAPDRELDTDIAFEADGDEVARLMTRWVSEGEQLSGDELAQVVECTRREARARRARQLGVANEDGVLVAMTKLYSDGRIAQVEDVYTTPGARGRGYARAMIGRALELARAARHELVFIVADDDGWPKELYARLGFDPVGRMLGFHRDAR